MIAADAGKRLSPEERREQLLIFGRDLFARYAFDALSMDEMASMAGVSKGLLYHYFKGRRGFYLETVRHVVEGCLAAVTESENHVPGILDAFTRYCRENAGIYKTIIRGGIGADPEVQAETDRVREYVLGQVLLAGGIHEPSPLERIALNGWIAFVETATAEWINQDSVTQAEFVQLVVLNLSATINSLSSGEKS